MPRSARVRADDIHAVYRLAGECRELGDSALWVAHLAEGFKALIRADFTGVSEYHSSVPRRVEVQGDLAEMGGGR